MNDEMLKLDNQLCFALYACSKEITRLYKPLLDDLGITYTQYITLLALWEQDNITVTALGEKLYLDSGTLTPLLKKVEGMGLITRNRHTEDERNVYIELTENGKNLKQKAFELPHKILCSTKLSTEEAIVLREDLKKILKKIIQP